MPTARYEPGVGVVNGVLYAVAGLNGSPWIGTGILPTLEAYDPATNMWTTKAPLPSARGGEAAAVLNGVLYVVGGYDTGTPAWLATMEAYDPVTNTWTQKASMPTARQEPGAGVINGVLYVVGGSNGSPPLSTVEAYDPETNTWTTKAPMLTGRGDVSVGVVNGVLYAVGGSITNAGVAVATVEAYDPVSNTWTTKAPMSVARQGAGVAIVNGILYVAGGWSDGFASVLSTVEAYDPVTDAWTTMAPMPTARVGLRVGVVNGVIYAVGGWVFDVGSSGIAGSGTVLSTNEAFTPAPTLGNFSEFPIPTASNPAGITVGPDGAIWFTEQVGKIGRITTAGVITEFTVPTAGSVTLEITAGPDGALWFAEQGGNAIGRITAQGLISEFTVPTAGAFPNSITAAADGALWFTEQFGNRIGRITTTGVITEFIIPTPDRLFGITAGPDGALWFAEFNGNKIGRITTSGVISEFALPTANSGPIAITAGPDGALWFTESAPLDGAAVPHGNRIGRITTSGAITEFTTPTAQSGVFDITSGPDGALWFTEYPANQIGRITTTGVITEFAVPTAGSGPGAITAGPDGALWFNENGANKIGRLAVPAPSKADQSITFGPLTNRTLGNPSFSISANASSGLLVTFSASGSCTVSVTTVSLTGVGSCTITADQAGDDNFNPAPSVQQTFALLYNTAVGHGFLQPINTPPQTQSVFKIGSTIPVKFQLLLSDGVTPLSSAAATIQVNKVSSGVPSAVNETVTSTVPNQGITFRYDAVSMQYIFNLGTKGWTTGTYLITAFLDDGSQIIAYVGAR